MKGLRGVYGADALRINMARHVLSADSAVQQAALHSLKVGNNLLTLCALSWHSVISCSGPRDHPSL